jgi:hypothetical protein
VVDDVWLKVFRRPEVPVKRLPYLVLGTGWGERAWDGQRPMRSIRPPRATVQAHMPTAGEANLEIEAQSLEIAQLRVATDDAPEPVLLLLRETPALYCITWSLPAGETTIVLEVMPESVTVTVKRLDLSMNWERKECH